MTTLLEYIYRVASAHKLAAVALYGAVSWFVSVVMGIWDQLQTAITSMDAIVFPMFTAVGVNVSPFAFMNYCLPLEESFALFVAWVNLWLLCAAVRFVKGWVPTMN